VTLDTLPSGTAKEFHGFPFPLRAEHREILNQADQGPGPHIITGPIAVVDAEPGDTVEIEIVSTRVREPWGWNGLWPGKGALPARFSEGRVLPVPLDLVRNRARLPWGPTLRLRPFFGFLATSPAPEAGRVSTVEPREFGDNLDNCDLVPDAKLYLPVFQTGAGVFISDGHALQGDGEVTQTALEASLTGTIVPRLHKGLGWTSPRAEADQRLITMGLDPDLDRAAELALSDLVDWIVSRTGWTADQAFTLFGLVGQLRVTQLVDGNKGVHAVVETKHLKAGRKPHGR